MKSARQSSISRNASSDLSRRSFLAVPAVVSAGIAIPGSVLASPTAARTDTPKRISLAYWPASERLESFDGLRHTAEGRLHGAGNTSVDPHCRTSPICQPLVDAAQLAAGEPRFAREGVSVRIHGLFHSDGVRLERHAPMAMYVHGSSPPAPAFYAWGFDGHAVSPSSPPTQFDVSIGPEFGLNLSFEFNGASAVQRRGLTPVQREYFDEHIALRFALDATPGQPKLRRGIYLLTWAGDDDKAIPDWWGYGMEVAAAVYTPQVLQGTAVTESTGETPQDPASASADEIGARLYSRLTPPTVLGSADFPYLLMSIDFPGHRDAPSIG